ncbi:TPA: DNA polymerase III subunit delta', partial [Acinetobacter baumannii]
IRVKLNQPQKNIDLQFDQLAQNYNLESLFSLYEELQQSKRLVEQNVQTQLIIDQLFIKLMNV